MDRRRVRARAGREDNVQILMDLLVRTMVPSLRCACATCTSVTLALAVLAATVGLTTSAVSPPSWADPNRNPCAALPGGWQLLQWPGDGRCYRIFSVGPEGPCPDTQELAPGPTGANSPATCRCPPASAQLDGAPAHDAPCYRLYERGPCPRGHHFAPLPDKPPGRRRGRCAAPQQCDDDGDVFWPATGRCYQPMTRGPCAKGELLAGPLGDDDDDEGLPRCACEPKGALAAHYWIPTRACYEHYTRGPCLQTGHLFLPGGKCGCNESLPHYHNATGRCYQLGSIGPCPSGHQFVVLPGEWQAKCLCKPDHILWPEDGSCYRLYTQGPCPKGQFLLDIATCATLCQQGRLYFPEHNICYKVGMQGPCPKGQIVLFEDSVRPSVDGISYRGMCGCPNNAADCDETSQSSNTVYCDAKSGMVRWNGTCQALYSRGPCLENQWLVPERDGRLLWDQTGWRYKQTKAKCECRPGYKPIKNDGVLQCQAPTVTLAKFLNQNYDLLQPWNDT